MRQGRINKKVYAEASDFLLKALNENLTDEQYFMRYSISKDVVSRLLAKLLFDLIEAAINKISITHDFINIC
ncbi:hypothetical protein [Spirosoma lituiforme]